MLVILTVLMVFMLIGAIIAIETKDFLSCIISVGAVGFLLSIAFLLLGAPDIAITQVVVEILCLVILIRATISRDVTAISGYRELFTVVTGVTFVILIVLFGVRMFADFPAFGSSVMQRFGDAPSSTYIREGVTKTGAPNLVTAVLLDFRAYDTLGEASILFGSIMGALAIMRHKARKGADEPEMEEE